MTAEIVTIGFSTFFAFCILFAALKVWLLSSATWTRQTIFAIRADLFDAALLKNEFNDASYREEEKCLNGLLRWIEEIDGFYIISILLRHEMFSDYKEIDTSSPLFEEISSTEERTKKALLRYIWFGSISGFIVMTIIYVTGKLDRFIKIAATYSKRMSFDDFARNEYSSKNYVIPFSL